MAKHRGNQAKEIDHGGEADSFGAFFRELREESGLSVDKLSELVKINKQYIDYLENEQFAKLPPAVYTRGFIVRCSKFLKNSNADHLLHLYARKVNQAAETKSALMPLARIKRHDSFLFGPQQLALLAASIFLLMVATFLAARLTPFFFAPEIKITDPSAENTVVNFSKVIVKGQASFVSLLTLNNEELYIGKNGAFLKEVKLEEGVNRLVFETKNIFGRKAEMVRKVVYIKNNPK